VDLCFGIAVRRTRIAKGGRTQHVVRHQCEGLGVRDRLRDEGGLVEVMQSVIQRVTHDERCPTANIGLESQHYFAVLLDLPCFIAPTQVAVDRPVRGRACRRNAQNGVLEHHSYPSMQSATAEWHAVLREVVAGSQEGLESREIHADADLTGGNLVSEPATEAGPILLVAEAAPLGERREVDPMLSFRCLSPPRVRLGEKKRHRKACARTVS
jgi:hypothetical protein